ncbi:hypothetical protein ACHHYP_04474 [Achlya hypogyna]|uniref:Uncharacterized protein n=1 Tax=Achlya hypogyna TaxID=1202772 RepID=A0A1V9Z170_ACHHY|nr:hypothetical protein ACHHYP_04474 [Achlya hypogyna]
MDADAAIMLEVIREDNLVLEARMEAMQAEKEALRQSHDELRQAKAAAEARAAALDADLAALRKATGQEQMDPNAPSSMAWDEERRQLVAEKQASEKRAADLSKDLQRLYKRLKAAPGETDASVFDPLLEEQRAWSTQQRLVQDLLAQCRAKVVAVQHAPKRRRVEPSEPSEHDRMLADVIAHFQAETSDLREFERLEAQVLQERVAELQAAVEAPVLAGQLAALDDENRKGRAFVAGLQDDLKRLAAEKLQLAKDMSEAQRRIQALTMDLLQFKLEKNELKHELAAAQTRAASVAESADALEQQLAAATADASRLQDQLVETQAALLSAEAETTALAKEAAAREAAREAAAAAADAAEAQLAEAAAARDALAEEKAFWEAKVHALERVVKQYGAELTARQESVALPEPTPASIAHGERMVRGFFLRYYAAAESKHRELRTATADKDAALATQGADLSHVKHVLATVARAPLPADAAVAIEGLLATLDSRRT